MQLRLFTSDDAGIATTEVLRVSSFDLAGGPEQTPEGFLVFRDQKLARVGTQTYHRALDGEPQIELRLPEEVFGPSLKTLDTKPVTLTHPRDAVDARNFRHHARGHVRDPRADAEQDYVVGDVVVQDAEAIEAIRSGKAVELSVGYLTTLEAVPGGIFQKPGHKFDGVRADYIQRDYHHNHLAIVPRGRANEGTADRPVRLRLDSSGHQITKADGQGVTMDLVQITLPNGQIVMVHKDHVQLINASHAEAQKKLDAQTARADTAEKERDANAKRADDEKARADAAEAARDEQKTRADDAEKKLETEAEKVKLVEKKLDEAEKAKPTDDQLSEQRVAYQTRLDEAKTLTGKKTDELVKLDADALNVEIATALGIEDAGEKNAETLTELIAFARKHKKADAGARLVTAVHTARSTTADSDVADSPYVIASKKNAEAAKKDASA